MTSRITAVLGLVFLLAASALASDLTGTWEGKLNCKAVDAATGEKASFKVDSVLEISQVEVQGHALRLNVSMDGTPYSSRALVRGAVDKGKGGGDFVACDTNDDTWLGAGEIDSFTFKVNDAKGKGTIKNRKSIFNITEGVPSGGGIGSCKGSWKRVSTEDPGVPGCAD